MRTVIKYLCILSMFISMVSCAHKGFEIDEPDTLDIQVVFDWRNAPDGNPESMALHLYNHDTHKHIRFIFTGKDGGTIRIPYGTYDALCMNADETDWAVPRYEDDIESYEIITKDTQQLEAYGLEVQTLPRAGGSDQRMADTPGMLWADRNDGFNIKHTSAKQYITLYPEEAVCHYTVDILDVENGESLTDLSIDATLSGVAEGYVNGQESPAEEKATMPFVLKLSDDKKSLHAEFLTFGQSASANHENILTTYMYLSDGTKRYYTFDVTNQVDAATDPHHVHIVVKGLKLPKSIQSGGGLKPTVNDWISEHVNLEM